MIAALATGIAVSACGSGQRLDASEPTGNFQVAASARWTTSQRLSQHTVLEITVANTGTKTIPNPAVTISDIANGKPAPAFQKLVCAPQMKPSCTEGLANQARPVWVVEQAPDPARSQGSCPQNVNPETYTGTNYSTCVGGPGGAATANANTWALPSLAPGKSDKFTWHVAAVQSGTYIVNWQVDAGLNGKAKAVTAAGGPPRGTLRVTVAPAPQQAYVNNGGQIVNTP
jgi:hypothetical protein